jgi:hypothetical protein
VEIALAVVTRDNKCTCGVFRARTMHQCGDRRVIHWDVFNLLTSFDAVIFLVNSVRVDLIKS